MDSQKIKGILDELTSTGTHVSRAYLNKMNKKLVVVAKAAFNYRQSNMLTFDQMRVLIVALDKSLAALGED